MSTIGNIDGKHRETHTRTRIFGPLDGILAAVLIAATVVFVPAMHSRQPSTVVVYRNDRVVARYPLTREQELTIQGTQGPVKLAVDGHAVHVTESSCRKHLCVHSGAIRKVGQQIVCVPNHIIVEIKGSGQAGEVDAVSR